MSLLPKDLLELQLGQADLLTAMYASDGAVHVDEASSALLDDLRSWCESDDADVAPRVSQPFIYMVLTLGLSDDDGNAASRGGGEEQSLQLELSVPVVQDAEAGAGTGTGTGADTEPPPVKVRVRQPQWMSKAEAASLTADMPQADLLTIIEHVKDAAARHLAGASAAASAATGPLSSSSSSANADALSRYAAEPTVRVWFYFPSISTRSKRDDIVRHAPRYGLTGFLLAGKPGVLCLEGASRAVDDYMRFIKTESWGDIPPQHKKVSERHREAGVARAFDNMREITDSVGGERRGERANRGDMKALEAWLVENGVGDAFGKIFV